MAPRASSEEAADESMEEESGHDTFVNDLMKFAEDRGINIDFNARVNGKHVDLNKLFKIVTERGGYDTISAEKLAWRKVGNEFNLGANNAAAYAFALKTVYYKNLAAYEIKKIHNRDPPPVEILERLTAKGADILTRTVENFKPAARLGAGSDSEDEGSKTPKEQKMDIDDPGSGSGRTTRGLRQAPPPRQLFQPDMSSSKQPRHTSNHYQSPQPTATPAHTGYNYSASTNTNSTSFIANYNPGPPVPLTLRPIVTPGNNPDVFRATQERAREARRAELGLVSPSMKGMMKPGQGFEGPNIYVRTLQGLRSGVAGEQDYALHHLVKISHERGDKYKFDAFPNLAEGLIEYVLGVSSLFYDVKWEISYTGETHEVNVLDGINGTPDILQRLECLRRIDPPDEMESGQFGRRLNKILEAGLTIRNLALLEDNAIYLAEMPQLRDFLSIALHLPSSALVTELKHYALEIAEQVTKYWRMDESDPLYQSLLSEIDAAQDRGAIITALRAVTRVSMMLDVPNLLKGMPITVMQHICEWMLLDDDELVSSCLDLLYTFTAVPDNAGWLLSKSADLPIPSLMGQLARLLQHQARTEPIKSVLSPPIPVKPAETIPNVPRELLEHFLKCDEPERSNQWLKAVFEEDPESFITQIALWQGYQARFAEHITQQTGLLPAAEFIKNVSQIFAGANAQVVNGASQKFIIKGIRPRHAPVDNKGRVYSRCMWQAPGRNQCDDFHLKPKHMCDHIIQTHLGLSRKEDGQWDFTLDTRRMPLSPDCFWSDCRHFARRDNLSPTAQELSMHVRTHLPDQSAKAAQKHKHNRTPANQTFTTLSASMNGAAQSKIAMNVDPAQGREAVSFYQMYENTPLDESGNAISLPLTSVLILRNLARNVPKAAVLMEPNRPAAFRKEAMERLFGPVMDRLLFVMAYNKPLTEKIADVIRFIEKGSTS